MKKLFLILTASIVGAFFAAAAPNMPGPDETTTVSARIHYPVNVSESITSFSQNARAMQILSTLNKENFNVSKILIKGWASPESSVAYNQGLSERRANDVKNIIARQYNFPESIYEVQGMGESWDEVINYINTTTNSTIVKVKDQLLDIIAKYPNLDAREAAIKSVGGGVPYRTLLNEAYPDARYADCEVIFTYTSISDNDAQVLFPTPAPAPEPAPAPAPAPAPVVVAPVVAPVVEAFDWKDWFIALQAGLNYSMNENTWTYTDPQVGNKTHLDLVSPQIQLSLGHFFTPVLGWRLSAAYAGNKSAMNHNQTAAQGFYPYSFKSVSAFADLLVGLSRRDVQDRHWFWTLFGGIGYGHGFDFKDVYHPWQTLETPSNALGFRGGLNLEYMFKNGFAFMLEGGAEAFTDGFNGMNPHIHKDANDVNFPFDVRPVATFGIGYHF